jgi:hypothetical protein
MSFRTNLIKARSHIIFLVALGCGLGLVTTIDREPKPPSAHKEACHKWQYSKRSRPARLL